MYNVCKASYLCLALDNNQNDAFFQYNADEVLNLNSFKQKFMLQNVTVKIL